MFANILYMAAASLSFKHLKNFFFFHNAYKIVRLKWVLGAETEIDFEVIIETFEL